MNELQKDKGLVWDSHPILTLITFTLGKRMTTIKLPLMETYVFWKLQEKYQILISYHP